MTFSSPLARLTLPLALVGLLFAAGVAHAQPAIDPEGDRILRAACKYLADARQFCVKVEVWRDALLSDGSRVQTSRTLDLRQQRPDRLHIEMRSARESRGFWLQNKTLTMLDRSRNFFGVMETPDTIDKAIDAAEDRFGVEIPLGDVLVADPYANLMESLESLTYLGPATVLDTPCHHLAFVGRNADYQVWFADGPKPLPRKISIVFKNQPGSPQITQIFSDWDTLTPISDSVFNFVPPHDAIKILVLPRRADNLPAPAPTPASAPAPTPK